MQIAVVLFDNFTALDAVGPHEPLSRMPGVQVTFVAERVGPIMSDTGRLALVADAELAEIPHPGVIVVPGGTGRRRHMANGALHQWLRAADVTSQCTIGVGEGVSLLAAAGPLRGRRAASRPGSASLELAGLGAVPVAGPYVVDGKYATAVDGTAGIDLAVRISRSVAAKPLSFSAEPARIAREDKPRMNGTPK